MSGDPIILPAATGHVVLQSSPAPLPPDAGALLLPLARAAVAREFGIAHTARDDAPWLGTAGACFITLTEQGRLRGCIGTLRPHRPLAEDVRANAVAAAFRDPRFRPLSAAEYAGIALEVSVLSGMEPIAFADEQDARRQLLAGVDGVVLEYGHHASTFLPQVWETYADPADFLAALKYKAGLPPDFWDASMRLMRYTVSKWREER